MSDQSSATPVPAGGGRRTPKTSDLLIGLGAIVLGIIIVLVGVKEYTAPRTASCNGETMTSGNTCAVTQNGATTTLSYQVMLSRSDSGNVGPLIGLSIVGGAILLFGIFFLYIVLSRPRRHRPRAG